MITKSIFAARIKNCRVWTIVFPTGNGNEGDRMRGQLHTIICGVSTNILLNMRGLNPSIKRLKINHTVYKQNNSEQLY